MKKNNKSQSQQYVSMRIVFEFPPKSSKDEMIKGEVKEIMTYSLQEQMMLEVS